MPDRAELLARLRAATGPDPALDREVALALGWRFDRGEGLWAAPGDDGDMAEGGMLCRLDSPRGPWPEADRRWPTVPPPVTGSVDAALWGMAVDLEVELHVCLWASPRVTVIDGDPEGPTGAAAILAEECAATLPLALGAARIALLTGQRPYA